MGRNEKYIDNLEENSLFGALSKTADIQIIAPKKQNLSTIDNTVDMDSHFKNFEKFRHVENGVEFWYARDLQKLLSYSKWEKFQNIIAKAQKSCTEQKQNIGEHWQLHMGKSISGKGRKSDIVDYKMTRYASYLTAINGDPSKESVSFAQNYFITETRKLELIKKRYDDKNRLTTKKEVSASENFLERVVFARGFVSKDFGTLKSKMDKALLGKPTKSLKEEIKMPLSRPLTDFTPSIINQAKTTANTLTGYSVENKDLCGIRQISKEGKDVAKKTEEFYTKNLGRPLSDYLENKGDIKQIEKELLKIDKSIVKGFKKTAQKINRLEVQKKEDVKQLEKSFFQLIQNIAISIMYSREDGSISTTELIQLLPHYIKIPQFYLVVNENKNEPHYYQIVRNIKSNKTRTTNIIYRGYAKEIKGGLKITDLGRQYFKNTLS